MMYSLLEALFVSTFLLLVIYTENSVFAHPHHEVLKKLIKCGFKPDSILDVGGNKGDWTNGMKQIFPAAKFFMIEGDSQHVPKLDAVGHPYEIALVAEKQKNVTFYVVKFPGGTGNSVFRENSDHPKTEITRTAYTIDSILQKWNVDPPVRLIKLDIQGSELNALKGAKETLKSVEVVLTEISVMNYNQGAPSFFEFHSYMESIGFAFYTIVEHLYDGQHNLLQMDVLFVRKTSKLWDQECTSYPRPTSWLMDNHQGNKVVMNNHSKHNKRNEGN